MHARHAIMLDSIKGEDTHACGPSSVHSLLAAAEEALQAGDADFARDMVEAATDRAPELPIAHFMAGRLLQLGVDLVGAKAAYEKAVALQPDLAIAWTNLAFVQVELGDYTQAVAAGRRALGLDQQDVDAYLITGRALLLLRRSEAAEKLLRRAVTLDPKRAALHHALGRALQDIGRSQDAIESHRQAINLEPQSATAWHGLGLAFRALGRFEPAMESFLRAVDLAPGFGEALADLAICRRVSVEQVPTPALVEVVNTDDLPLAQRISARFALAKELDELGLYDEAFACLSAANRLFREDVIARQKGFCSARFRARIDQLMSCFTAEFINTHVRYGSQSEMPVFVVGHYRSGTSLIEQILASHSAVHGAGELQHMLRLAGSLNLEVRPDSMTSVHLESAGRTHLERLCRMAGGAQRVVDKHPDNVLALGIIACLYPKARIIVSHRNILDNVLSCFFQRFSEGMAFSNDLVDCARRHLEVERLIAHWRRVLPIQMLEVDYELLVENTEAETRRLVAFLDLPWQDECLQFYQTERTVNTPSVWGVRRPIYASAVGRWRHYKQHLQAVIDLVESETQVAC